MSKISSQDFLKYYQKNFGAGIERLRELMPPDRILDLDDFIQAPDQIWPDFAASLEDPERENLLDAWARLRAKPVPDMESPFLAARDPLIEHPVNPPPPGGPILPPGFSPIHTVLVAGKAIPLGDKLDEQYGGERVFVKRAARIDTSNWAVTGGKVHFKLLEGPNGWGPWTPRCDFSLQLGEVHVGCSFTRPQLTWWALVVSAAVESKFTAQPFAW